MKDLERDLARAAMGVVLIGAWIWGCGAALGPADRAEIADTAATIERCQEVGRACKADGGDAGACYVQYDACMQDAGLHP